MNLLAEKEARWKSRRKSVLAWEYFGQANDKDKLNQTAYQMILHKNAGVQFFGECYISKEADVYTHHMIIGNKSFVAHGAVLRGVVHIGDDVCVGSGCYLAGGLRLGDHTMLGAGVAMYGFNHGTEVDTPMGHQPLSFEDIIIGRDCWIGANATIVAGVELGDHCIVAAGAVVTTNFPAWSVIGGVPARLIRSRQSTPTEDSLAALNVSTAPLPQANDTQENVSLRG